MTQSRVALYVVSVEKELERAPGHPGKSLEMVCFHRRYWQEAFARSTACIVFLFSFCFPGAGVSQVV